jgi:hypothetical protein
LSTLYARDYLLAAWFQSLSSLRQHAASNANMHNQYWKWPGHHKERDVLCTPSVRTGYLFQREYCTAFLDLCGLTDPMVKNGYLYSCSLTQEFCHCATCRSVQCCTPLSPGSVLWCSHCGGCNPSQLHRTGVAGKANGGVHLV